jgi:hypothetical protein
MSLNAKTVPIGGGGTKQPLLDIGTYPARVVRIVDLGLQNQRPFKGKEKPPAHEVNISYELLDAFMVDEDGKEIEDKPRWIHETFPLHNLSADLAKSTKRYMALDPDMDYDGDFTKLIGTPCNVTVVHGQGKGANAGKTYENIGGVSAMRDKDAKRAPALVNEPAVFTLDDPDLEVFNSFPQWLQDKIKTNLEFGGSKLEALLNGGTYEDGASEEVSDEEKEAW